MFRERLSAPPLTSASLRETIYEDLFALVPIHLSQNVKYRL